MKKYILFLITFFIPAQLISAADTVYFGVRPPDENIRFSEKFSFRMETSYPEQYEIMPDTSSIKNDDFEVLDFSKAGEVSSGTLKNTSWSVVAQAYCIGTSTFPAITWNLQQNGRTVSSAPSPEFNIRVSPMFDPEEVKKEDIRDIYPPVKFPNWLLVVLAVIAAAAFLYYLYRVTGKKAGGIFRREPWADKRTAYQRAYDRTTVLENSSLVQREKIKEFYIGLTSVFRLYLTEEFALSAELFTTRDLTRQMKRSGIGVKNVSMARDFLNRADMVKFAKLRPESVNPDLMALRDLLQALDFEHTPVDTGYASSEGYGQEYNSYSPDTAAQPGVPRPPVRHISVLQSGNGTDKPVPPGAGHPPVPEGRPQPPVFNRPAAPRPPSAQERLYTQQDRMKKTEKQEKDDSRWMPKPGRREK